MDRRHDPIDIIPTGGEARNGTTAGSTREP